MTNFIMNVAAIAISLPVALVIAPYLGVAGEVIFFASLATAGMPFFLLIGILGGISGALFNYLNTKLAEFRKKLVLSYLFKRTQS